MSTSYLHVRIDLQFNYRVRRKWSCFKALSVGWYNCVYNERSARFFDTLSSTAVDRRRSASGINALLSIKLSLPNFCRVICQVTTFSLENWKFLITKVEVKGILAMSMDLCLTVNKSSGMSTFQENSSDASLYPPSDYPFQYQVISVIIGIVIFLVGMLGNILVIVVVCRTKCMHTPTNCYLLSLSVADCLVLLSATLPSIPEPFFHTGEWPWGRITCSVLIFLQYLGVQASSLSITMFTIERYIAICHPMRAQRMCTVQRAKRIIIAIWIFTILYCAPWLGLTAVVENEKTGIPQCVHRLEREKYLAYYLTDLIAFYVVPLLVSGILYALIARILFINTMPRSKSDEQHCTKDKFRVKTSTSNSRKQVTYFWIVITCRDIRWKVIAIFFFFKISQLHGILKMVWAIKYSVSTKKERN